MVTCHPYNSSNKLDWDSFISQSKTPLFFFKRDFLEYHSDRFIDSSLMFYYEGSLVALFPASIANGILTSHGGLTYGGLLTTPKTRAETVQFIFEALIDYAKRIKIEKIIYKAIPYIFAHQGTQEDLYFLHSLNAKLIRRDLSSVIYLQNRQKLSKGRRALISRAIKNGLHPSRSYDWKGFHALLSQILEKHNTTPVHSADELSRLASLFPDNMRLMVINSESEIIAGALLFIFDNVIHTQYLAVSEKGKELGALDLLLESCIDQGLTDGALYFNFGISTEQMGKVVNHGLLGQKESFGARGLVIDFYEINLND